jgi:SAM-dependent methyltransferase
VTTRYDDIGRGYAAHRRPEPRWAAAISAALGDGRVVDVGAGAGSYEPAGTVLAVEPSAVMIRQRAPGSAPAVRAVAEALPMRSGSADAGLASLTVHHWTDWRRGLAELLRVAPARTVVFTWDQVVTARFWLLADYLPEAAEMESTRPALREIEAELERLGRRVEVHPLPVPADCADGVVAAYYRRPEALLDPTVAGAMSAVALLPPEVRERGLGRLRADLADGTWHRRYGHLLELDELDAGYRLVVATPG